MSPSGSIGALQRKNRRVVGFVKCFWCILKVIGFKIANQGLGMDSNDLFIRFGTFQISTKCGTSHALFIAEVLLKIHENRTQIEKYYFTDLHIWKITK